MQQLPSSSLVGSVVERKPGSNSLFKPVSAPSPLGFPSAQHRSKSAFARAREAKRNGSRDGEDTNTRKVPIVRKNGSLLPHARTGENESSPSSNEFSGSSRNANISVPDDEQWKSQMKRDNERTIAAMSEEERNRHAAEIIEQLGPNVAELLRSAREARAQVDARPNISEGSPRGRVRHDEGESHPLNDASASKADVSQPTPTSATTKKFTSPPRGILSLPTSRASSPGRHARKLRFADVTPKDVYVYQSEPSSPRRPIGLLLPPPEQDNSNTDVEMTPAPGSELQRKLASELKFENESQLEEGTPEYIRKRFFPDAQKDPALEWIEGDRSENRESVTEPRFDLSGVIIPLSMRDSLPTHLGLHHHGGSSAAGYTLSDLYLLARSSVPAQRATVLGVLSKLVRRLARREKEASEVDDREGVRNKALVLALAALPEKGTVGLQAIDLIWTCVVYWDQNEVSNLNGVELRQVAAKTDPVVEESRRDDSLLSSDPISSLPFSALLPQIVSLLDGRALPQESQVQLLSVLHRFARHSLEIATAICATPRLVASVVNAFLLTPVPPSEYGPLPNPLALDFLNVLALSSRSNAHALKGPVDALLRFIATASPLSSSPFTRPLAESLLRGTLDLYATLGTYGLYSGIATTAAEYFTRLSPSILRFVDGDASDELRESWLHLLSVWMVCAVDPHRTTPAHDLLWSQVAAWGWGDDLFESRKLLLSRETKSNGRLWSSLWDALASWLEGCLVNSPKAGQGERANVIAAMKESWEGGVERGVVGGAVNQLVEELSIESEQAHHSEGKDRFGRIAGLSRIIASFTRLCLTCLSTPSSRPSSSIGEQIAGPNAPSWITDATRYLSRASDALLCSSAPLSSIRNLDSRRIDLAFRVEVFHMRSASTFLAYVTKLSRARPTSDGWPPTSLATLRTLLPGDEQHAEWIIKEILEKECNKIDCGDKMKYLIPFFKNMIRPDYTFYLSPLFPTSESIQHSTTQGLPANCISGSSVRPGVLGLPLNPDWPCIALDHLLRSGTSPILTNPDSVPESWNASETDLVQASLSLMLYAQRTLGSSDWRELSPTFEHVVFSCMKVFMLEHNQNDSNEEVFRDSIVTRLIEALLEPYTLRGSQSSPVPTRSSSNLEVIARGFLGEGTPFFQFYTDFIALYDAISFSHKTFARVLLPPTSMVYPLDYRKLLWGDFGHTLRTIRTPIEEVPSVDIKEFFWPVETDMEMLGWYLRALLNWPLDGFVRLLAVHNVACNIWPDLHCEETTQDDEREIRDKRSRMMLLAIFNQGRSDIVKEVVRYVQPIRLEFLLPPSCFNAKDETQRARLAFIQHLGENKIAESVERIFIE